MKTTLTSACLIILVLPSCIENPNLAAETSTTQEARANNEDALWIQTDLTWPADTISVCFRTPGFPAERAVIRAAANEWERATQISFVGWNDCTLPFVSNGQIGILRDEVLLPHGMGGPSYGAISVPYTWDGPAGANSGCTASLQSRDRCIRNAVVHEFGHVLGFAHEHKRTPRPLFGLSTCSEYNPDGTAGAVDEFGPWDLYSVMNYCDPRSLGAFDQGLQPLSEFDRLGAQSRYGRADYFADLNGDLRADAIVVSGHGITARLSTGTGFGANVTFSSVPYYGRFGTYFADIDGDYDADAIVVNENGIVVRRSNGSSFGSNEIWSSVPYFGRHGIFFADVTGDEKADAIVVSEESVVVRRSTGSSFGANEVWLSKDAFPPDPLIQLNGVNWSHIPFSTSIQFGKVNDDLAYDMVMFSNTGVRVFRSTGSSFAMPSSFSNFYGNRGSFLTDVDGDNKADLLVTSDDGLIGPSNGGVTYRASTSVGTNINFGGAQVVMDGIEFFGPRGTYFANVDLYPGAEAIAVSDVGISVRQAFVPVVGGPVTYGPNALWSGPFYSTIR